MKKGSLIFLLVCLMSGAFAQMDFHVQYANAKELFRNGKYTLAMESFKPLIPHDQQNPYSQYASFYYAVAAYHQGFKAVAKDMFNQIRSLYPNWDKTGEVNFWLGKIHFDNRDYFQGLKVLSAIEDKKFEKDIEALKTLALLNVTDPETLKMMHEEYPKDEVVAIYLASTLAKDLSDPENKKQLEDLIDKFKLKRTDFIPEAPKTVHKDKYSVSLMLPFMVNTLEPTTTRKRNQILLDFYEGMKMGVDTLKSQHIDISLRAYDTERSADKVKKLLETEELRNTDLIVGPFYPEEHKIVQDFSQENRINIIHPFSNNTELTGLNPYSFLYQPASETLGRKSAEFIAEHAKEKTCIVFYGTGKKDSVLSANFIQKATELGIQILQAEKINSKESKIITEILATPTEFDEFKYPKEFTLRKDTVESIFVASDDPLIYTKVVGGVETRGDSILVVGSENWLDDHAIDLEKYQVLGIVLASPNFVTPQKAHLRMFEERFLKKHGRVASSMARMGYEFMLFTGHQLKSNGVYFQEGISKDVLPGYLTEGFDYRYSRDNQLVPFITFKRGVLTLIEKR